MDNTYPPEAWQRLGKALETRRGRLGYGFRQRGKFLSDRGNPVSEKTLARLERGERTDYPAATIAVFESLYELEPGSLEAFLRDGEFTPARSPGSGRREAARRAEEFLASLTEEDRRQIAEDFIEAIRSRAARGEPHTGTNGGA